MGYNVRIDLFFEHTTATIELLNYLVSKMVPQVPMEMRENQLCDPDQESYTAYGTEIRPNIIVSGLLEL